MPSMAQPEGWVEMVGSATARMRCSSRVQAPLYWTPLWRQRSRKAAISGASVAASTGLVRARSQRRASSGRATKAVRDMGTPGVGTVYEMPPVPAASPVQTGPVQASVTIVALGLAKVEGDARYGDPSLEPRWSHEPGPGGALSRSEERRGGTE